MDAADWTAIAIAIGKWWVVLAFVGLLIVWPLLRAARD